jgi:hypothetical protein
MAPPTTLNFSIVDTFPIFELDGVTKHTGVTGFTITIWHNGVVRSPLLDQAVAEIGSSGEYKFSFTALDVGYWSWEVTNTYNDDIFGGSELVTASNVKFEMTASDNGVIASFGIWMTKDGVRVTDLTSMTLTARSSAGVIVYPFAPVTSCSTEGVFKFTCSASLFSSDVEYYLDITAARTTPYGSWSSNLGFTKV